MPTSQSSEIFVWIIWYNMIWWSTYWSLFQNNYHFWSFNLFKNLMCILTWHLTCYSIDMWQCWSELRLITLIVNNRILITDIKTKKYYGYQIKTNFVKRIKKNIDWAKLVMRWPAQRIWLITFYQRLVTQQKHNCAVYIFFKFLG